MKNPALMHLCIFSVALAGCGELANAEQTKFVAASREPSICNVSSLSIGRAWSPQEVGAVSFSGVKLGSDAPSLYASRSPGIYRFPGVDPKAFSLSKGMSQDGIGVVPWLRTVYLSSASSHDAAKDLSFVWRYSDAQPSPSQAVSVATLSRSPSASSGMVVSSVRLPLSKVNASSLEASFRKRFGPPTSSYVTSGACGVAKYLIYGSDPRMSNGWSFDHFYRCVAAYGPANMPPFQCSPALAQRRAWFGLKLLDSGAVVSLENNEIAWNVRYSKGYKPSVQPQEN